MGERGYHQPHWWFDPRVEHVPARPFWHLFLCLPARQTSRLHTLPVTPEYPFSMISAALAR